MDKRNVFNIIFRLGQANQRITSIVEYIAENEDDADCKTKIVFAEILKKLDALECELGKEFIAEICVFD